MTEAQLNALKDQKVKAAELKKEELEYFTDLYKKEGKTYV